MSEPSPSFFGRLGLAFAAFVRTLLDAEFARGVVRLRSGALPAAVPAAPAEAPAPKPPESRVKEIDPRAALQLLALLQREGRFVDFLEEDVAGFTDAQVGAAARVVHEGCRKALRENFVLEPVRSEAEGSRVTVPVGYDADAIRLTGNVVGSAPHQGTLQHRGFRVAEVKLPKLHDAHDARVVQPAEVEL